MGLLNKTLSKGQKGGFGYIVTEKYTEFYSVGNDLMKLRFGVGSRVHIISTLTVKNGGDDADKLNSLAAVFFLATGEYVKGGSFAQKTMSYFEKQEKQTNANAAKIVKNTTEAEDSTNLQFVRDSYNKQPKTRAERRRDEKNAKK